MAKFPARLPRSRLEKPRSRQPSQPALSYEHVEIFLKRSRDVPRSRKPGQPGQPGSYEEALRPNRAFLFFFFFLAFCNLWKLINAYAKFRLEVRFFVIERPSFVELDNVRARAKAWGEVRRDVILSSKPNRTQRKWLLCKWKIGIFFFVCSALAIPFQEKMPPRYAVLYRTAATS